MSSARRSGSLPRAGTSAVSSTKLSENNQTLERKGVFGVNEVAIVAFLVPFEEAGPRSGLRGWGWKPMATPALSGRLDGRASVRQRSLVNVPVHKARASEVMRAANELATFLAVGFEVV